ncbi:MAG TPA: hypothetical protein ENH06_00380 [bacterium]|nr:hypothetical protein [bacterium]
MQFKVPKFIEHEAKIVGPFTFGQFIYLAIAGVISVFFFFTSSFTIFILVTIFVFIIVLVFISLKIEGRTLPVVFKNFLGYAIQSKLYLWKRKTLRIIKIREGAFKRTNKEEDEIEKKAPSLKIVSRSKLKNLSIKIEMKTR